jgi:hypothetical protein
MKARFSLYLTGIQSPGSELKYILVMAKTRLLHRIIQNIFPPMLGPGICSAFNRNEYQKH